MMNPVQVVAIQNLGQVSLDGTSSVALGNPATVTADFAVTPTTELTGVVSETGMTTVGEDSFVSFLDNGLAQNLSQAQSFFVSTASANSSGAYQVTLATNRQYDFFASIDLGDDSLWGMPAEIGSDTISFDGPATRNFVFPTRPAKVTFSGTVTGPDLSMAAQSDRGAQTFGGKAVPGLRGLQLPGICGLCV